MKDPQSSEHLSYRDAGVDIDAGDAVVRGLRALTSERGHPRVLGGLGHFGGFFRVGPAGEGATIVASIDGVGTKVVVAQLAGQHAGIGQDIVHHCVNDILACGAEPLFFLDYFGTGRLDPQAALEVIGGIVEACEAQGIALLGGETAEMPGLYSGNDYDIVGAIVGMIDASRIIDGSAIRAGDLVVGIPSAGFHTNGYSLVRAALGLNDDQATRERLARPAPFDPTHTLAGVLLQPHRSYRAAVRSVVEAGVVHGMAHITGGGLPGNVSRVIPAGLVAEIDRSSWEVPPVFGYVAEAGHIADDECFRAFNMGIGFVLVCPADAESLVRQAIPDAIVVGRILETDRSERVEIIDRRT